MTTQEAYRLGMAAFHAARYENAIELLGPLADAGPGEQTHLCRYYVGQAHYQLAVRLFGQDRFLDAAHHFQAAATFNADGVCLAAFLATCHACADRLDAAANELHRALHAEPDNTELRVRLALAQHQQGQIHEAKKTLLDGLARFPEAADLHYQLGVMSAAEEEFLEAEHRFELAILCQPTHAAAHERLAQIYAVRHQYESARAYLQHAHELDPRNPRIALQLSVWAYARTDEADHLTIHQRNDDPVHPLNKTAMDRLGQAILKEPDFIEAFLALPESDVDEEVFSMLAATIERALEEHPQYADLHCHCGAVYRRLGHRHDAIEHMQRAVAINPRYVKALIQLAELYGQVDQPVMGVERLEQAVAAGGDYPDVHFLLGKLCTKGGRCDRARAAYQRALDLNHNYEAAREALAALPA